MANRLKKFPALMHVTMEGEGNDMYFQVNETGVLAVDEPNKHDVRLVDAEALGEEREGATR